MKNKEKKLKQISPPNPKCKNCNAYLSYTPIWGGGFCDLNRWSCPKCGASYSIEDGEKD